MKAKIAAHFVLRADVGARGGIVADQDHRERRHAAAVLQLGNFRPQFRVNLFGDGPAFDELRHAIILMSFRAKSRNPEELLVMLLLLERPDSSTALGMTRGSYDCSTRLIIAFCRRNRSASNCSGSVSGGMRMGAPKIARNVANGRGTTNRSQLFIRQELEYSM